MKATKVLAGVLAGLLLLMLAVTPAGADMITGRPGAGGFWSASSDGRVTATGGAPWLGDASHLHLWEPIVGIAATQSGNGYWLAGRDSGVFAFGDAAYHGNLIDALIARDNLPPGTLNGDNILDYLHGEIIDIDSTGNGYYLLGRDGGVFTFGHLPFHGSAAGQMNNATSLELSPTGGYYINAADGRRWACSGGVCVQNAVLTPPSPAPPPPSPPTPAPAPACILTHGVHPISSIPNGWYRIWPRAPFTHTYYGLETFGGDIIRNEITFDGPQAVYIDRSGSPDVLELTGCLRHLGPAVSPFNFTGGVYVVGHDIQPGFYRVDPDDTGSSYWGAYDIYGNILDNGFSLGPQTFALFADDVLFDLGGFLARL